MKLHGCVGLNCTKSRWIEEYTITTRPLCTKECNNIICARRKYKSRVNVSIVKQRRREKYDFIKKRHRCTKKTCECYILSLLSFFLLTIIIITATTNRRAEASSMHTHIHRCHALLPIVSVSSSTYIAGVAY